MFGHEFVSPKSENEEKKTEQKNGEESENGLSSIRRFVEEKPLRKGRWPRRRLKTDTARFFPADFPQVELRLIHCGIDVNLLII